jgi:hypothetical protein
MNQRPSLTSAYMMKGAVKGCQIRVPSQVVTRFRRKRNATPMASAV